MSNVLIGIIGIILFIGLALAGALFLGPRFQESRNNADAAVLSQGAAQVAHSVLMYRTNEGRDVPAGPKPTALVTSGYLKSLPVNPTDPNDTGAYYGYLDATGQQAGSPSFIVAGLLGDKMDVICAALAKQVGQTIPEGEKTPRISSMADINVPVGCYRPTKSVGAMATSNTYVIARI